jgi:predicted AlkP superfamily phosphohydrolase/phosphomutase
VTAFQRSFGLALAGVITLMGCAGPEPPPAPRVILLGVDGADWDVLDPLIAEGRLPAFARMKREGAHGVLESLEPIFSPVVWASIGTGKVPEKHGITSFTVEHEGHPVPVTSNLVRTSRIWDILGRRGHDVGVIGWWTSWPATPVNGFLVTERAWPLVFGEHGWPVATDSAHVPEGLAHLTYPEGLFEQIRPLIVTREMLAGGAYRHVDVRGALATVNENGPSTADMYAKDLTFARFAERLYPATRPDFFSVYLELTDVMAHYFWEFWRYYRYARYGEPTTFDAPPNGDPESAAIVGANYEGSYVLADEVLGALMAAADDSTLIMVVSDHGYGENTEGKRLLIGDGIHGTNAHWHVLDGVILAWGYGVAPGAVIDDADVIDVTPTILHAMGEPIGEDMDGEPLMDVFGDAFARRDIARIETHDVGPIGDGRPIPAAGDSAQLELLRSLGYVD